MTPRLEFVRERAVTWWTSIGALGGDGLLYCFSGCFALMLAVISNQRAQWQWGYLSVGPYALVGVVAIILGRRVLRRERLLRVILLSVVIVGTVVVPLGLEAHWRQVNGGHGDAQPEIGVITRAGQRLANGQDPYRAYDKNGHVVDSIRGLPIYESFFPYFPLMAVFGLPSASRKGEGLTDARIVMTLMTLMTSVVALSLLRLSKENKIRVAQVLVALPTGALFLSTGGDDMPILALMLLGVAALQRRQTNLAGVSIGLAAAMKLTAWPMALGALLVVRDQKGRATWKRLAAWMGVIVLATTVPYAIRAPAAFMDNVFAFPLGLAAVKSPAASDLPGHLLTVWLPLLGHVLMPVTFVVGGYFVTKYLRRHWPLSLSQLLGVMSVSFLVLICVASATRIGYVIYPANLALWSYVTREHAKVTRELVTSS
ncbi:MAG: glycosyltransferase 87 family protein [Acidimicrobiales bacterium]